MDTKWTPNNGSNSDNPNHLPGTNHRNNGLQSADPAVTEEKEKQENPISGRLDSGRGNDNTNTGTIEHSDSTISNPVNDKVDTSEKTNESKDDNTSFDLSYFDGIYKTKEKDDPLDLSYFETPTTREETPTTRASGPARTEETPATSSTPETSPTRTESTRTEETPTSTSEPARTDSVPETPATSSTTSTTEETPTEVAMAESSETPESEIPEEIDEEPSEETHSVMDAMEHLDDSGRWWEFGSEDYERTRKQIARISPTAEEEFMDFADLINDVVNGNAGQKVKAVLKLISKATWDTFNILPKVCVDVAKDIVYRLIKGDYDTSGLTEGEQKQVERFAHNKQNVSLMNAMLNTMDKPIESSIRGKGKGQATDESDYNEGITENTNDVVSDVTKKYIISQPWVFKAIQRW